MAVTISAMELAIFIRAVPKGFDNFKKAGGGIKGIVAAMKAMSAELLALAASKAFSFIGTQVGASITALESFSREMALIGVVSGKSDAELGVVEAKVRELGRTTVFTATESAGAFKLLLQAGATTEQALIAISPALNAAAVSGESFGKVADDLTDIMNQFQLGFADFGAITDTILVGSQKATTTMGQLSEGLAVVGAGAEGLDISLPMTVAALDLLADAGLKGAEGGTKLRTILLSLIGPTGKASDLMDDLGIQVLDSQGQFVGLTSVLSQFREKGLLETAEGFSQLSEVVGKRTAVAFRTLVRDQEKMITISKDLEVAFGDQANEAQAGADRVAGSFFGVMTAFRSLKTDILLSLGQALAPAIEQLIELFRENENEIRATAQVLAQMGITIGTVLLPPVYLLIKAFLNVGQFLNEHQKTLRVFTFLITSAAFWLVYLGTIALVAAIKGLFGYAASTVDAILTTLGFKAAVDSTNASLTTMHFLLGGVGLVAAGLASFFVAKKLTPEVPEMPEGQSFQAGTGLRGVPHSGNFFLHKGEGVFTRGQMQQFQNDNRREIHMTVHIHNPRKAGIKEVVDEMEDERFRMEMG
jgi:TP901 family phage tail tape measure protein